MSTERDIVRDKAYLDGLMAGYRINSGIVTDAMLANEDLATGNKGLNERVNAANKKYTAVTSSLLENIREAKASLAESS